MTICHIASTILERDNSNKQTLTAKKQSITTKGDMIVALDFPEDTLLASRYVKQAIPLMIKNGIAPNPCNFALWYVYVANRDLELKNSVNRILEDKKEFSQEVSRDLFRKHIIENEVHLQEKLQESLKTILYELVDNVEKTQNGIDDYQRSLDEGLENISDDLSNTSLSDTIKLLIKTTQAIKSNTNNFQNQLAEAGNEIQELRQRLSQEEKNSYIDPLTQIGNRRAFDKRIIELFQKEDSKLTLIFVDLDHFKKLNDNYGHQIGDKVLQSIGKILQEICSDNALTARYGGEEFIILLEDSLETARNIVESIQASLSQLVLKKRNSGEVIGNITASFGVAQKIRGEFPEDLIERADKALYTAKISGRNQIKIASA